MKNNVPFDNEALEKYGVMLCREAAMLHTVPSELYLAYAASTARSIKKRYGRYLPRLRQIARARRKRIFYGNYESRKLRSGGRMARPLTVVVWNKIKAELHENGIWYAALFLGVVVSYIVIALNVR